MYEVQTIFKEDFVSILPDIEQIKKYLTDIVLLK